MTAPRTGKRILVLDDAKHNRGLTRETFSPLGIELRTTPDSEQVLEMLADGDTDVFVTDLQFSGVDFLIAVRQRLFTTDQNQGTGLGLAICHELIKQCGGRITASNARNAGAVFTITLPRMRHAKVAVVAETAAGVA